MLTSTTIHTFPEDTFEVSTSPKSSVERYHVVWLSINTPKGGEITFFLRDYQTYKSFKSAILSALTSLDALHFDNVEFEEEKEML